MGTWGPEPWDCDAAADWYGRALRRSGLIQQVEDALDMDPKEYHEEIRAAAYLLVVLGRPYVWPPEDLERHLRKATSVLLMIADETPASEAEEVRRRILAEAEILQSRLREVHAG